MVRSGDYYLFETDSEEEEEDDEKKDDDSPKKSAFQVNAKLSFHTISIFILSQLIKQVQDALLLTT